MALFVLARRQPLDEKFLQPSCILYTTNLVLFSVANHLQGEPVLFRLLPSFSLLLLFSALLPFRSLAQENAYIVAYDHYLEEPGNLEVEYFSTFGTQRGGNDFHAFWVEFEYGATAWWTTEFYLDAQSTFHDSTLFTGFRWENRFRPLQREHFINPVLYVEYEDKNGADKILKEGEGHDVEADF